MNDAQYLQHNQALVTGLAQRLRAYADDLVEEDDPFLGLCSALQKIAQNPGLLHEEAPALIQRLFTTYPELAPEIPRDLLWFLGGDCLHYMPDEEIALHQSLDELREEAASNGQVLDYTAARARLANKH